MKNFIEELDNIKDYYRAGNPTQGLPEELFLFVSRCTPIVNVDTLAYDKEKGFLLSWRDDEYAGKGWHVPGGIVRFKEKVEDRLVKTIVSELKCPVNFSFTGSPITVQEVFPDHETRGHFVSFLYTVTLPEDYQIDNGDLSDTDPGFLQWHKECPSNLVECQDMYLPFIDHQFYNINTHLSPKQLPSNGEQTQQDDEDCGCGS
tara:strand:- start:296 stop:904 length:609 start_codon:yes stop_codon:yes gene_type:complete